MKSIGYMIIVLIACLFFIMALVMPATDMHSAVPSRSVIGGFGGPPTDPLTQWIGMFVVCPALIFACALIDFEGY